MKNRFIGALACAAALCMAGCGIAKEDSAPDHTPEYVFTYAENQAEDYPTTLGARRFAELVWERTDGRIEIQVNAGGTLGDERTVIEQMQFGGVDFARVSLSPLAEFVPKLNVLQMPYLYQSSEHMWKVLDGEIGDSFLNSFGSSGLTALSWYDAGSRSFYCRERPIERLEDMKGLRIRVQESDLMVEMIEALGGVAVPLAFDQVYSGLQRGTIDGAENNWASYESTKHYEVAPYYTIDEHTRVPEVQLASDVTWNKLSAEDRQIIRECAQESARYERRVWQQRSQESERVIREAGCAINELSEKELVRFQEAVTPVYKKFCGDYMDIVDEIVAEGRE